MIGFLLGSLCVAGLIKVGRHRRWQRGLSSHGPWGRRAMTRVLFERLEATPAQEKVLLDVIDQFVVAADRAQGALRDGRKGFAEAFRGPLFDETSAGEATARFESVMEDFRKAVLDAVAKAHEVLDERQRGILADLIEKGFHWQGSRGAWPDARPYRHPSRWDTCGGEC